MGEVTDQVTTATIAATPKNSSNHLSVHQWLRSAIRDSQQPNSPIGFLFLKLPPPPCAVLLESIHVSTVEEKLLTPSRPFVPFRRVRKCIEPWPLELYLKWVWYLIIVGFSPKYPVVDHHCPYHLMASKWGAIPIFRHPKWCESSPRTKVWAMPRAVRKAAKMLSQISEQEEDITRVRTHSSTFGHVQ